MLIFRVDSWSSGGWEGEPDGPIGKAGEEVGNFYQINFMIFLLNLYLPTTGRKNCGIIIIIIIGVCYYVTKKWKYAMWNLTWS